MRKFKKGVPYKQGFFTPINPQKYIGKSKEIVWRSSWELKFMTKCDNSPNIKFWNSEEVVIPYFSAIDQKMHRYFVDFAIVVETREGTKKFLVEIKPRDQIDKPKPSRSKYYNEKCLTWIRNQEKWNAATDWCIQNGFQFVIMDEYDLGIKSRA